VTIVLKFGHYLRWTHAVNFGHHFQCVPDDLDVGGSYHGRRPRGGRCASECRRRSKWRRRWVDRTAGWWSTGRRAQVADGRSRVARIGSPSRRQLTERWPVPSAAVALWHHIFSWPSSPGRAAGTRCGADSISRQQPATNGEACGAAAEASTAATHGASGRSRRTDGRRSVVPARPRPDGPWGLRDGRGRSRGRRRSSMLSGLGVQSVQKAVGTGGQASCGNAQGTKTSPQGRLLLTSPYTSRMQLWSHSWPAS